MLRPMVLGALICGSVAATVQVSLQRLRIVPRTAPSRRIEDWRKFVESTSRLGPSSAPIKIVEFSDFECANCKVLSDQLAALQRKYEGTIEVIFRHYPVAEHAHSMSAALASQCAAELGRFAAYHDSLFRIQNSLSDTRWASLARGAGIRDTLAFNRCLASPATAQAISRDQAAARELGVTRTPAFMVNDELVRGIWSDIALDSLYRAAVARSRVK